MNEPAKSERVPGRLLIPALFTAQAGRTPDAPAVLRADGSAVRYAELAELAGRIAARLRAAGVRPGDFVGVCLRRGPELLAALLGVWQAGGAYVPLDPQHPAARLEAVLEDTAHPVVLIERATEDRLPASARHRIAVESVGREGPYESVEFAADSDRPAYVLHTSGSTGRPKGVLVPHGGIANRVRWLAHRHRLGAGDRMLLKTTIGFDAAGLELFAPLVSGGAVVLAPEGAERDPAALLRTVGDRGVTILQGVPSLYRRLVEEAGWERVGGLRLLFSAGEPLHAELCRAIAERAPGAEIWNTYGPTEASVDITEHRWDPAQDTGAVPIGRPIGNMRVVVLDQAGRPVPVGVPGELHAGGVGLALGYLGRPGQSAERFVPDPHRPGERLYRTGDRVRWRADGTLEYLGRLDHQVKVNGVRIEPGEVEAALAAHPWVRAAVAAAVPDGTGGYRLVAWVQSRGEALRPQELRAFLRGSLPDPLVPTAYVPVTEFPLTPNGKIDRSALPDPADTPADTAHVPVRNPAERAVAEEWARLIGTPADEIGALHDFFQLGGSSLMLNKLAAGLSQAAGRTIPATALLTATTVEQQAVLLTARAKGAAPAADEPVGPVPRDPHGLPLSPGQQGMWLLDRLRPGSAEWNAPVFLTLPAVYDDTTLGRALTALAERHEILRTRYALRGAEPVQIADLPAEWELRTAHADTADELNALVAEEFTLPFDLARGPVRRALAVRGRGTLTVVLSIHHIACDGWTSVVLERDLRALAEAAHTGTDARLPELPVQYADHAVHRRRRLTADFVATELEYWKGQLDGIVPVELPADRPRPATRDAAGRAHVFTVPAPLAERAAALGRSCGATLQQTLLTAFAALVARYTGSWDIPVGVPVAGRTGTEVADVAGYFLNTLVLRCDAGADTPFRDALVRVRDTAREAFTHQELPFGRLVEELDDTRDPARTPLYQVMFDVHEEGRTGTAVGAADADAFRGAWRTARTDLTLVLQRQADGSLLGLAEYATALFDAATVERFTDCWIRLLESVTDDPARRLHEADILPAPLRAELLASGRGRPEPGADAAAGTTVHAAITASARRAPRETALVCGDESWTYARLERRAGEFAARLRGLGAGPDTVVAVMLGRSPDLVAAFLGVWKAGAAYVPLDPAAPDERNLHVLADSRARVLVTDGGGAERLAGRHETVVLAVDAGLDDAAAVDAGLTDAAVDAELDAAAVAVVPESYDDPDRLAYIMYTSGSTGRPKGVAVAHRSLLAMLRASQAHLDFGQGPDDAWLALAQVTFDISCTELFMPLVAGGRVVLAREREQQDHAAQLRLMDLHEVSHLQVAPPHWQMLIDAGLGHRSVVGQTGGEPCPPVLARELSRRLMRFINEYGLTETTIAATRWDADDTATAVPVGHPYPHVTARVLDADLRPVPYGVTGELCVGGAGLALGYHARPALTAAAFVPDPYGTAGARLYRTGDRARMRADGTLEFAGRADGQVKIRGRRVETGEVQAVLAEHPAVAQAFVTVHTGGSEAALIGYFTPAPGTEGPAESELLDHCARRLPDYMLPALLVRLERLPLTRHNKVDTAALPVPDLAAALADEPYSPPEGPVEEALAEIWADELYGPGATRRVGARQGFFRIGGNSVKAARVIARIQEEFDVELPLRAVFERPTVQGLATAVEEAVRAEIESLTEAELAHAHREFQP